MGGDGLVLHPVLRGVVVSYVCLNFGDPQECQCCGGWIHAGDPPEVPVGEPAIDGKYCSQDCHDSMTRR
jgi:hypothetical protein